MSTSDLQTRMAIAHSAYLWACNLELRAFKPGNVSIYSEGHDMTVADFELSAEVSAPHLCNPDIPLGERIFNAIAATFDAVGCNTNLGIVLLAAPLILAFQHQQPGESLHQAVTRILQTTTLADAEWVYQAIRLAHPGGLGEAPEQDVRAAPGVTLLEAMRLAAHRDSVARQYTASFHDIFHCAIPMYHSKLSQWDDEEWATVAVFVGLLSRFPDSHVERKFGSAWSGDVTGRMTRIEEAMSGTDRPLSCLSLLWDADTEFKSRGINPGTTADLTVACLLALALKQG